LLKKIWNHGPRRTDGSMEYWGRCNAVPAQPKIKKEKKAPGPEAASCKPQASSATKRTQLKRIINYERNN